MSFARTIGDIPTSLILGPLEKKDLETYYVDTISVRTGSELKSPIRKIISACESPAERNSFLFLGHRGCGKSTELNKMAGQLEEMGHRVITIPCDSELDRSNLSYEDLLILMGDFLLRLADEKDLYLEPGLVRQIQRFWRWETVEEETRLTEAGVDLEAGASLPAFLNFLKMSVKGSLKYGDSIKTTYRQKIEKKSSEWIRLLQQVIGQLTERCNGCQPILIFEDLDKLEPEVAWRVFYDHYDTLSRLDCPVIYTFPISLSYDPKFNAFSGYFQHEILPMIKIATPEGNRYEKGYQEIREIVSRRMDVEALFEGGLSEDEGTVLNYLISKTGGALRDLFHVILDCSRMAKWANLPKINRELADISLEEMKSDLTRRIERRNYAFLVSIWKGNHKPIDGKEMLLEMLQAGVVLEYNGERWQDVHPLVKDFLEELRTQGQLKKEMEELEALYGR